MRGLDIAWIIGGFAALVALMRKATAAVTPHNIVPNPGMGTGNPSRPPNDLFSGSATVTFDDIYKTAGKRYNVDWMLLKAIAQVESGENANATNPSDPSYGLMQVLCVSDGPYSKCKNKLNVAGWDQATPDMLYQPTFNVNVGAQVLQWNMDHYGINKGIAIYNNWSARDDPTNGPFRNQSYVNKVLDAWSSLQFADLRS